MQKIAKLKYDLLKKHNKIFGEYPDPPSYKNLFLNDKTTIDDINEYINTKINNMIENMYKQHFYRSPTPEEFKEAIAIINFNGSKALLNNKIIEKKQEKKNYNDTPKNYKLPRNFSMKNLPINMTNSKPLQNQQKQETNNAKNKINVIASDPINIELGKLVDKIYVMNFEKSLEKFKAISDYLKKFNVEPIRFIIQNPTDEKLYKDYTNILKNGSRIGNSCIYAYLLGYIEIIKQAKIQNLNSILILDENIIFHKNFKNELQKINIIPKECGLIYLGCYQKEYTLDKINIAPGFYKASQSYGSFAIIIKSSVYDLLITNLEKKIFNPDQVLVNLQTSYSFYVLWENLIISDLNEKTHINTGRIINITKNKIDLINKLFGWNMDHYDKLEYIPTETPKKIPDFLVKENINKNQSQNEKINNNINKIIKKTLNKGKNKAMPIVNNNAQISTIKLPNTVQNILNSEKKISDDIQKAGQKLVNWPNLEKIIIKDIQENKIVEGLNYEEKNDTKTSPSNDCTLVNDTLVNDTLVNDTLVNDTLVNNENIPTTDSIPEIIESEIIENLVSVGDNDILDISTPVVENDKPANEKPLLKSGLSFLIHSYEDSTLDLDTCIGSITDMADEIIFINNGNIAKETLDNLKTSHNNLFIYQYDIDIQQLMALKNSTDALVKYHNWCLTKVTRNNVIEWSNDYMPIKENLAKMIRKHYLRLRTDKYLLWFLGKKLYMRDNNNFVDVKSSLSGRVFSIKHGFMWEEQNGKLVEAKDYIESISKPLINEDLVFLKVKNIGTDE